MYKTFTGKTLSCPQMERFLKHKKKLGKTEGGLTIWDKNGKKDYITEETFLKYESQKNQ